MTGELDTQQPIPPVVNIPPPYCPIPAAVHPRVDEIGRRTIDWMATFDTYTDETRKYRSIGNRASEWAGRLAPDSTDDGLQIFSDWVCFGFAFDDLYCDMGPTSTRPHEFIGVVLRMLHRLDNPEVPVLDDNPCAEALRDLSRRVRARSPAPLVRRWADGHRGWLLGSTAGVAGRAASSMHDDIPLNLVLRSWDGAMRICHSLIEIAEGTDLPDHRREDPRIRAVTEATFVLVMLVNDLFSYRSDMNYDAAGTNTVELHTRQGLTREQALEQTVRLHDRIMVLFLALNDRIGAGGDEQLRRYLGQLRHFVRGNLDWSRTVPRYNHYQAQQFGHISTDGSIPVGNEAEGADRPSDGALTAPPIPTIAWWWDQL